MPELSLEILPPRVYAERVTTGRTLNFDLRFTNCGGESRRLASITVEVFDAKGACVLRRVVDEHGLRPAIEMVPIATFRRADPSSSSTPCTPFPASSMSRR